MRLAQRWVRIFSSELQTAFGYCFRTHTDARLDSSGVDWFRNFWKFLSVSKWVTIKLGELFFLKIVNLNFDRWNPVWRLCCFANYNLGLLVARGRMFELTGKSQIWWWKWFGGLFECDFHLWPQLRVLYQRLCDLFDEISSTVSEDFFLGAADSLILLFSNPHRRQIGFQRRRLISKFLKIFFGVKMSLIWAILTIRPTFLGELFISKIKNLNLDRVDFALSTVPTGTTKFVTHWRC